jgi:hypothetical protein
MLFPEWMAQNVVYSEHRPRVNLADPEFGMGLVHALLHKSHHWAYEQERRMINWREPPGWRAFPPQALKCIIMGAKISSEDEAFVRGLVTRRPHLLVYRTKVDAVDYKLVFEPAD